MKYSVSYISGVRRDSLIFEFDLWWGPRTRKMEKCQPFYIANIFHVCETYSLLGPEIIINYEKYQMGKIR